MLGAQSNSALRGDYSRTAADFTIRQDDHLYSDAERAVWARLVRRQSRVVRNHAAREFLDGLALTGIDETIPHFERVSDRIEPRTGWRLVAVPGFIPDGVFFDHLAGRRFPVSVWVRHEDEIDYLVEPDLFHDFFGHVPLLLHPVFADYLQRYGRAGQAADETALPLLARLYWYMVEFGLIETADGLKAYGAGMLSSKAETLHSVSDPRPHRVWFDPERVMRTRYLIDSFQKTYFVVQDFETLFAALDGDMARLYARVTALGDIDPAETLPADRLYRLARP